MKRSLLVLVGVCWCLAVMAAPVRAGARRADARHAHPVIFDTDVDFDDTVALALLAQQHAEGRVSLRAVTITNNGGGLPGKAYRNARCLLDSLGLTEVPVADATYDLPHAFSDQLRQAVDLILDASIPDCSAGHTPPSLSASELLADEVEAADGRLTLIATGPLTNVALAASSAASAQEAHRSVAGAATDGPAAEEILRLEREYDAAYARHNAEQFDRFYTSDFTMTARGRVVTRAEMLARLTDPNARLDTIESMNVDGVKVRVYGDTAVTTGSWKRVSKNADGKDTSAQGFFTRVWIKRDGRWLMAVAHYSPVAAPAKKQ